MSIHESDDCSGIREFVFSKETFLEVRVGAVDHEIQSQFAVLGFFVAESTVLAHGTKSRGKILGGFVVSLFSLAEKEDGYSCIHDGLEQFLANLNHVVEWLIQNGEVVTCRVDLLSANSKGTEQVQVPFVARVRIGLLGRRLSLSWTWSMVFLFTEEFLLFLQHPQFDVGEPGRPFNLWVLIQKGCEVRDAR
jgi:hypothetical protein